MIRVTQRIFVLLILVAGVTPASAAVQIFIDQAQEGDPTDRSAFMLAIASLGITPSFEGFNDGFATTPGPLVYDDFEIVGVGLSNGFRSETDPRFVSEGTRAIEYTAESDGTSVTFGFTEPINVFGIDINDWGTNSLGILRISNDTGTFFEEWLVDQPPYWERGERLFFGAIDDQPFSSVTVFANTDLDRIGLDYLTYGQLGVDQIPEPSSLLIWSLIGTAGLGYVARRRRQHRV